MEKTGFHFDLPKLGSLLDQASSCSYEERKSLVDAVNESTPSPSQSPTQRQRSAPSASSNTKVQTIWGEELGKQWTPVSDDFLENFHRLADGSLSPSDAMFVIMLMRFKWDARHPYPALTTIAKSMNRSVRYVRSTCARLEKLGLIKRESSKGDRNRYNLHPLFDALKALKTSKVTKAA